MVAASGRADPASGRLAAFAAPNRRACTMSTATSDGDTPAMRDAMPSVPGRQRLSFSSASR